MLAPGNKGLGFAVGQEPLPSVIASFGVELVATDLVPELAGAWADTGQNAATIDSIYQGQYLDRANFDRLVSFQAADMNNLSTFDGEYDFFWSSCAFEHLGSLELGLAFVENSMRLLKPGGISIHTSE